MIIKRKVLTQDGRGRFALEEQELTGPEENEVLIDMKATLISSGTELGKTKAMRENPGDSPRPPAPFGYQGAGVVIESGPGCGAEFPKGRSVACMGGGYAQHATCNKAPKNLVFPIPDNISCEEAAFNHLAATSLQALRRAELQIGEYAVVAGMGLVGQLACQLASIAGCYTAALDFLDMRLEAARALGADITVNPGTADSPETIKRFTGGGGIDAAFMAFGGEGTPAFEMLMSMMKTAPDGHAMGRIVIVGGCTVSTAWAAAAGNVDVRSSARTGPGYHDKAWEKGSDYSSVFVRWDTRRNVNLCIDLMARRRLNAGGLISRRVPISEALEACEELVDSPEKFLGLVIIPG